MDNRPPIRFKLNPAKSGINKVLGPLEAEILHVVWQLKEATVSQVHRQLQEERDIAYTTVMTTMSRLEMKRILKRTKIGMSYLYTPAMPEAEFASVVVKNVLDSLFNEFGDAAFGYILDYVKHADDAHVEQIQAAIKSHRPAKG